MRFLFSFAHLAGHLPTGRQGFRTFEWEKATPSPEEAIALREQLAVLVTLPELKEHRFLFFSEYVEFLYNSLLSICHEVHS